MKYEKAIVHVEGSVQSLEGEVELLDSGWLRVVFPDGERLFSPATKVEVEVDMSENTDRRTHERQYAVPTANQSER